MNITEDIHLSRPPISWPSWRKAPGGLAVPLAKRHGTAPSTRPGSRTRPRSTASFATLCGKRSRTACAGLASRSRSSPNGQDRRPGWLMRERAMPGRPLGGRGGHRCLLDGGVRRGGIAAARRVRGPAGRAGVPLTRVRVGLRGERAQRGLPHLDGLGSSPLLPRPCAGGTTLVLILSVPELRGRANIRLSA